MTASRAWEDGYTIFRVLNEILAEHTRQDVEKVQRETERDFFMSSEEAKGYGIVDEVMSKRAK